MMLIRAAAMGSVFVARTALACPACASGQSTFKPALLVMIGLPLVVGVLAVRAIIRALHD
jgi:hypothetical protein